MKAPVGKYRYGFHDTQPQAFGTKRGLDESTVIEISKIKGEPKWMLKKRLEALAIFQKRPFPKWGPDLSEIDFQGLQYYSSPSAEKTGSWDEVPQKVKETFERLGIPEAERKFLAGVGVQYDSEMLYHSLQKDLEKKGVIFTDMDTGLKKYGGIVRKHFGTLVPASDNKFAALNTAVWSGGTFMYVPKSVRVEVPLQAYFRINTKAMGQFERTLIIADEGSDVHYVEGCSAPIYSKDSLHAAVVEIFAMQGSRVQYTTIQNWSENVYNLVTKRAKAEKGATVFWLDGNIGSKTTIKYPCIILAGEGARGEVVSVSFAGSNQNQDTGAKMIHLAPNTSSMVSARSISKSGGIASYRGLVHVSKKAKGAKARVECHGLIMDKRSVSNTIPKIKSENKETEVSHEASVSKLDEEKLFYLQTRGLATQRARQLMVQGFVEPFVKQLPMEYAVELNRLIDLELEGEVG